MQQRLSLVSTGSCIIRLILNPSAWPSFNEREPFIVGDVPCGDSAVVLIKEEIPGAADEGAAGLPSSNALVGRWPR